MSVSFRSHSDCEQNIFYPVVTRPAVCDVLTREPANSFPVVNGLPFRRFNSVSLRTPLLGCKKKERKVEAQRLQACAPTQTFLELTKVSKGRYDIQDCQ